MKILVKALLAASCVSYVGCQSANEDRSFYQQIDTNDWPGDRLSERQVNLAIAHFADATACKKPWRWALIGPNTFLLKGTSYLLVRVPPGEGFVPNIYYSRGYWGGDDTDTMNVSEAKWEVQRLASDDCRYEHK